MLTQTCVLLCRSQQLRSNGSLLFPRESERPTRNGLLVSVEADIGVCSASAITFVRLLIISDLITGFLQHRANKSETKAQCVSKNLWGCFARTYQMLPANISGLPSHRLILKRRNCCLFLCGAGGRRVDVDQLKCTVNCETLVLWRQCGWGSKFYGCEAVCSWAVTTRVIFHRPIDPWVWRHFCSSGPWKPFNIKHSLKSHNTWTCGTIQPKIQP